MTATCSIERACLCVANLHASQPPGGLTALKEVARDRKGGWPVPNTHIAGGHGVSHPAPLATGPLPHA